jgi:hypothetical protein
MLDSEARSRRKQQSRDSRATPGTTLDLMMLSNMKRVG